MSARNTHNGKTIMEEKKTDIEIFAETVQNNEEFKANAKEFIALQHTYAAAIKEITTKLEILDSEFHIKYDHKSHTPYRKQAEKRAEYLREVEKEESSAQR